jgi:hypothetical protein
MPNSPLDKYKREPKKTDDSDWNGPQSSEDMGREKLRPDSSGLGYSKPVDISRRVDGADDNSGFSGKLPSDE